MTGRQSSGGNISPVTEPSNGESRLQKSIASIQQRLERLEKNIRAGRNK